MKENRDRTPRLRAESLCFFFYKKFQIQKSDAFMREMRDFVQKVRFKCV